MAELSRQWQWTTSATTSSAPASANNASTFKARSSDRYHAGSVAAANLLPGRDTALKLLIPWVSFSTGLLVAHPLDTIRVRWQTLGQPPLHTLRHDGVRSLFAGITTPMLVMGPVVAGLFAGYEALKPRVAATGYFRRDGADPASTKAEPEYTAAEHFVAGAMAGGLAAQLLCPIFVMRVRQQTFAAAGQAPQPLATVARNLVAKEGLRGFYRGNLLVTANEALARGCFFASYGGLKSAVDASGLAPNQLARDVMASWAGALAFVTVSFPIVTVATRVAVEDNPASGRGLKRIAACYRGLCDPHGPRVGLTRGVSIALLRSFCWMSVQMPLYDFLSRTLKKDQARR